MTDKILKKIIILLEKRGPINLKKDEKVEDYNFLKKGHIDSINLIKFILELEEAFKINLSEKDTTSKNFGIISGLKKIIKSKLWKNFIIK